MNKDKKYPRQCWAAIHEKGAAILYNNLTPPQEGGSTPLLELHGTTSRFTLVVLDYSTNDRRSVKGNITGVNEIAYFIEQYEEAKKARKEYLATNLDKETSNVSSPAYSVTIKTGNFKGKTPAQILIDDPSKKSELTRTTEWLESNLDKYPANQTIIDAIEDAIYLLDTNQLKDTEVVIKATPHYVLFEEPYKTMHKGTIRASIKVVCEFDRNNSWHIVIDNFDIKGTKSSPSYENKKTANIYLNDKEMAGLIFAIKTGVTAYQNYIFGDLWEKEEENAWKPNKETTE